MLLQAIAAGASAAAAAASLGMTTEQQITAAAQAAMTSGQGALNQEAWRKHRKLGLGLRHVRDVEAYIAKS